MGPAHRSTIHRKLISPDLPHSPAYPIHHVAVLGSLTREVDVDGIWKCLNSFPSGTQRLRRWTSDGARRQKTKG